MQYCSLQHQTLVSPPDTSTTGCHFWFGSASSFFLKLFLCSFPVAYRTPTDLEGGGSSFSVISSIMAAGIIRCITGIWAQISCFVSVSLLSCVYIRHPFPLSNLSQPTVLPSKPSHQISDSEGEKSSISSMPGNWAWILSFISGSK